MHAITEIGNSNNIQHGSTMGPARYDLQIKAQADHGSYISSGGLPTQNISLFQINHGHSPNYSTHIQPHGLNFDRANRQPTSGKTKINPDHQSHDQPKLVYARQGGKGVPAELQTLKETLNTLENSIKHTSLSPGRVTHILNTIEDLKIEALRHKGDRERLEIILASAEKIGLQFKPPLNSGPDRSVKKSPAVKTESLLTQPDITCLKPGAAGKYLDSDGNFKVMVGSTYAAVSWTSIPANSCFKIFDTSKLFNWKSWDEGYAGLHLVVNGLEQTDKIIFAPISQLQLTQDQINPMLAAGKNAVKYQIGTLKDDDGAYAFADWISATFNTAESSAEIVAQALTGGPINPKLGIEDAAQNDNNNIFHYISLRQNSGDYADVELFDQKIGDSVWFGHVVDIKNTFLYPNESTVWFSLSGDVIYLRMRAQDSKYYWARFDQLSLNSDQKAQVVRAAKNVIKDIYLNHDLKGALAAATNLKKNLNLPEAAEVILAAAVKSSQKILQKPEPPTPVPPTDTPPPTATRTPKPAATFLPPTEMVRLENTPVIVKQNPAPAASTLIPTVQATRVALKEPAPQPTNSQALSDAPNLSSGKSSPLEPGNLLAGGILVAAGVGLGYLLWERRNRGMLPIQNPPPGGSQPDRPTPPLPLPKALTARTPGSQSEKPKKKKNNHTTPPKTIVGRW